MNQSRYMNNAYIQEDPEAGQGHLLIQTTEKDVVIAEDAGEFISMSIPQALALHQKLGQMLQEHLRQDGWLPMKPALSVCN